jgi:lipopolysaccharide export LptBFGC system permease protein LptF
MHRRNADALATFFTCFGAILVIYYPLLMMGLDRCKSGAWPSYFVWTGNVILLAWGLWLRRKVMRY